MAAGGLVTTMMSANNTFMHLLTRDEVRGRVMSLFTLSSVAMMPLGQVPMGWWMEWVRPHWVLGTGVILVCLGVGAVALAMPQLWHPGA